MTTLSDLADPPVAILGLGREGLSTYRFFRSRFPEKRLGLLDRQPLDAAPEEVRRIVAGDPLVEPALGEGYLGALSRYAVAVKTPGIPPTLPEIQAAVAGGLRLTSQAAIFLAECPGRVVGVTGTKGKSTTTSLVHAMLREGGLDATLVGNIGIPFLDHLDGAGPRSVFAAEMSSHQLEGLDRSPHVAVMLPLAPEHLDHYGTVEAYYAAKETITGRQGFEDVFAYAAADPEVRAMAARSRARPVPVALDPTPGLAAWREGGDLVLAGTRGAPVPFCKAADVPLLGDHNLGNVLLAAAAANALGVAPDALGRAIRAFRPLAHRLEPVGVYRGIAFFNDSLATVPHATVAALDALGPRVKTLLAGGYDRGLDFDALGADLARRGLRTLLLFPTTGERIADATRAHPDGVPLPEFIHVESMEAAVAEAFRRTEAGEICLLSPSSASFGLFKDYRERGEAFRREVERQGSGG
ncbi:MAG: UDP-N-acetylmuramoyl-L-alanine--D-glutamate ligase [Planctomycetales bacterium]|nr:UDP-N-acetylmuramoyl-L-alanine--D-glutamate ligase [Planctomycetales bacterium]